MTSDSTAERTRSGLCLLSANNGKRDNFDLDLFFIPLLMRGP